MAFAQDLQEIGLSEIEAKTYAAMVGLGPTAATDIAERAGLKRPTTYLALDHLMQRGLVSEELRRGRRLYTPQEPEKLRTIMKKMRRQAMAAELKLDEILPELKAVQHELVETPQIIVKRGLEGIKNIFEDIASSPQSWYYFGAAKEFLARFTAEELKDIHLSFDQIRAKAGRPKILLMTDAGVYDVPGFRSKRPSNRDIKVVQREIKSKSALIVFHRGIAVLNFGAKPFGIIVRNQEIAEIVKLMFLQAWKSPNDK